MTMFVPLLGLAFCVVVSVFVCSALGLFTVKGEGGTSDESGTDMSNGSNMVD